jgi:hypothetical protein
MYQWYVSTYVVSYVELVANFSTTKPQCTGPVHAILIIAAVEDSTNRHTYEYAACLDD